MKIEQNAFKHLEGAKSEKDRKQETKEHMADQFEEIFAKYLVNELTKDSFKMTDNMMGTQTNSMYRDYITNTLAGELAKEHKLGFADMIMKDWKR